MMVKVLCDKKPLGDIRERQPKSPGQKAHDYMAAPKWNKLPQTAPQPVEVRWANCTRAGRPRCTHCGHETHALANPGAAVSHA